MRLVGVCALVALAVACGCAPPAEKQRRLDRACRVSRPERVPATLEVPWLPAEVARHRPYFLAAAEAHGVDAELVAIVTLVESGGWARAKSGSGARGLMQLMPATAREVATERGLAAPSDADLDTPAYNVDLGAWYFARQLEAFGQCEDGVELAAAAYNAGPGALRRHLDEGLALSDQTERYRRWVGGMWNERHLPTSATFAAWVEAGGDRLLARAEREMRDAL